MSTVRLRLLATTVLELYLHLEKLVFPEGKHIFHKIIRVRLPIQGKHNNFCEQKIVGIFCEIPIAKIKLSEFRGFIKLITIGYFCKSSHFINLSIQQRTLPVKFFRGHPPHFPVQRANSVPGTVDNITTWLSLYFFLQTQTNAKEQRVQRQTEKPRGRQCEYFPILGRGRQDGGGGASVLWIRHGFNADPVPGF